MNLLTGIYAAASGVRNGLYDHGLLRSHRLARPVVSVGNLSTGGAGKTPFVIALGELLKARGISFDVLSRGYRRKTRGALVVEADGSAADFGDEPLLISRRLGVPVIVGESRYQAGRLAEKKFEARIHILDDGFQHRALARDFDIVLMTGQRIRRPSAALRKAAGASDGPQTRRRRCIAGGNCPPTMRRCSGKLVWRMKRQIAIPQSPPSPVVFCGIARPRAVFCAGTRARYCARGGDRLPGPSRLSAKRHRSLAGREAKVRRGRICDHRKRCHQSGPARGAIPAAGVCRVNSSSKMRMTWLIPFSRESGSEGSARERIFSCRRPAVTDIRRRDFALREILFESNNEIRDSEVKRN